jgi:predicted dehydrogenase
VGGADRVSAYAYEVGGFCGAIRTGAPLQCGPERALASARACLAAWEATETKARVTVAA